jgi:hypothetical protein
LRSEDFARRSAQENAVISRAEPLRGRPESALKTIFNAPLNREMTEAV